MARERHRQFTYDLFGQVDEAQSEMPGLEWPDFIAECDPSHKTRVLLGFEQP